MTDRTELERQIAELQARLAALPEVDPLLVEAREIAGDTLHRFGASAEQIAAGEIKAGGRDDAIIVHASLAALRRGMELAKPELTREQLGDAIVKVFGEGEHGFAQVTPNNITALHAALTEAALSRVPAAAWPGDAEAKLRGFRDWAASLTVTDMNEIVADNGITAGMVVTQEAGEQVRRIDRLLAHMTGGAAKTEPEWIDWHGGECPVPAGTRVEVRFRRGNTLKGPAEYWGSPGSCWKHGGDSMADIIAYRILGGAQ